MKRSLALVLAITAVLFGRAARAEEPARPPAPARPDSADGTAPHVAGAGDIVTIKGRIVNGSGNPLPKHLTIDVWGIFPGTDKKSRSAPPPAADGTFTVDNLLNGRMYTVTVQLTDHVRWEASFAAGTQDAVVRLTPGYGLEGSIRGRVLGSDGKAVGAGVVVEATLVWAGWRCMSYPGEESSTTTRADGSFVVEYLRRGSFLITASSGDKPTALVGEAFRIPEGSSDVVLHLAPVDEAHPRDLRKTEPSPHVPAPSAITGRLRSQRGMLLGEGIRIFGYREGIELPECFYPSPSGVFDTGTLAPGKWNLRVHTPSGLVVGIARAVDSGRRDIEIPLIALCNIGGKVVGPDGKPVGADCFVSVERRSRFEWWNPRNSKSVRTVKDGTFLFEYIAGDSFWVSCWVQADRFSTRVDLLPGVIQKGVAPDTMDLVLQLASPVVATGFLKGPDGEPVPDAEVRAYSAERDAWDRCTTDAKGAFSLPAVAPGRVRLSTSGSGEAGLLRHSSEGEMSWADLGEAEAPFKDIVLKAPGK